MTVSATSRSEQIELLLAAYDGPRDLAISPALDLFLFLLLCRRRSSALAREGLERLRSQFVDWNEVRVSSPHEIALAIVPRVTKEVEDEASSLRELLAHVYAKHNKLDLDFMLPKSKDLEDVKRRERMTAWLSDRFPSVVPFFEFAVSDRQKALTHAHVLRILPRLGWVPDKPNLTTAREALTEGLPALESVAVQWALLQVGESYCHAKNPACRDCPLKTACPSAVMEEESPPSESVPDPKAAGKRKGKSRAAARAPVDSLAEGALSAELAAPAPAKKGKQASKSRKASAGKTPKSAPAKSSLAGGARKALKSSPSTKKKAKKKAPTKSRAAAKKAGAKPKAHDRNSG